MSSDQLFEGTVDRGEAVSAARDNLNFFAALALENIFKYAYPPIFLAIWQILITACKTVRGKTHLAIGIPRGFGKTIILKLYVVYLVLFSDRKFILIVCNTQELAENFLADVVSMLSNGNIISIFGSWQLAVEKDTLKLKKFSFRGRQITLAAAGAGTSLRGLNIRFVRPDIIIMDDMQSREQAESQVESVKVLTWMLGTLLKAAAPDRCLYIFVGNMYPFEGSILKKLKYNPAWISFICGAILEDGQSIWPELKPVEELITELENDTSMGHPEIFFSEVMNDEEAGTRSGVDISLIGSVNDRDLPPLSEAGCIIVDPSVGTKKSDDIVIGAVQFYGGIPVLTEVDMGKFSPKELIRRAIAMALRLQLPAIVIEGTSYQATLQFWFNDYIEQLQIGGLTPLLIYSGRAAKNSRIVTMFKLLVSKQILLHESIRSLVTYQITHFNPLKTNNKDDLLDVLAYIEPVKLNHMAQLAKPLLQDLYSRDVGSSTSETLELAF
jgi:hypothetical protein